MKARIHHVGVSAPRGAAEPLADLAAAIPMSSEVTLDLGEGGAAFIGAPNIFLARSEVPGGAAAGFRSERAINALGIAHMCIQGRDGTILRSDMEAAGTDFFAPPVALGTGFTYAYARAADGRLLELEAAPKLPERPSAWLAHLAYVSERPEELSAFYAALLAAPLVAGGRFRDNPLMDRMAAVSGIDVEIWWVQSMPIGLEFFRYNSPKPGLVGEGIATYSHVGIEVLDLDAALRTLVAEGGQLEGAISEGADGRAAWARDPDGNRIRLLELHNAAQSVDSLPHPNILAEVAAARAE
jgi:catechol 2,3-dioxygenase-like lactoylglutathione lyase family enzyme